MKVLTALARVLGLKAASPAHASLKTLSVDQLSLVTGGNGTPPPPPPSSPHPRWLF